MTLTKYGYNLSSVYRYTLCMPNNKHSVQIKQPPQHPQGVAEAMHAHSSPHDIASRYRPKSNQSDKGVQWEELIRCDGPYLVLTSGSTRLLQLL